MADMFELKKPKRKRRLTKSDKERIAAKQSLKCKKLLHPGYHIDHIKEFSRGGSDLPSNLQALCGTCHAKKSEEDRHKKSLKRKRDAIKKEKDPIGLNYITHTKKKKGKGRYGIDYI